MDNLGHELLLLMLNLSRMRDRATIVRLFEEALGAAVAGVTVRLLRPGDETGGDEVVELATPDASFGRMALQDPKGLLAERELAAFRNAIRMLAVVLENIARAEQLAAANKELEAFGYSVSHDLQAPLRHIDGYLGLLRQRLGEPLAEELRAPLASAGDAARRMGTLIDDLLSFSRMGRAEMARERVDLGALVREVIAALAPDAAGREVRWKVAELPAVTGDRALLRAAFANLLGNALKFTRPRPRAEIEVGSQAAPDPAERVLFVRDNGVGFDPQYADRLFGVFKRLHRAEEFEGNGVGLANVRRIVERHGGRTWAESAPGQGATFYLSLPGEAPPAGP